jgi:hypothetical protein
MKDGLPVFPRRAILKVGRADFVTWETAVDHAARCFVEMFGKACTRVDRSFVVSMQKF